jgi:hypothetical protein
MASLASEVSGTQMVEFFGRFGRFGGNMAKLQRLLGNDELMEAWVKRLDEFPEYRLVHGVFNKQDDVLAAFKARCAAKGLDFGKFSWVGSEVAPDFDPNDPETVVVLDATLDTLQNTFKFAWAWTVDGQERKRCWNGMLSDRNKLRLVSDERPDDAEGDGPDFKPWTLSWKRIKLDTNVGKKPIDVRNPKSPGCALLFMSAEHPARIKATDYEKRFGFWLPGLRCLQTWEWSSSWRVPYVNFDPAKSEVIIGSYPCGASFSGLAVPSLRE